MSQSRWQDIFLHLKNKGFSVYPPATKVGECTEPYLVLKTSATTQKLRYSSMVTYYDVLCYIPRGQYSQLEVYFQSVKDAMKELQPMIMPTYTDTEPFYDDMVKAHMVSTQYRNNRKI